MKYLFVFLLFLIGCSPQSLGELRFDADVEMKKLTAVLEKMENLGDIQKEQKTLRKHFNRIADLLITAHRFSLSEGDFAESPAAIELFQQLARLYEIAGVRVAIESTQKEAINRLDKSLFKI